LAGDFGFPPYTVRTSGPFAESLAAAAEARYSLVNGNRVVELPEITVKAKNPNRKPKKENIYRVRPDYFLTAGEIEETGIADLLTLLATFPCVTVRHRGWQTSIETFLPGNLTGGGSRAKAKLAINGVLFHDDVINPLSTLSLVHVSEIAEIHLVVDPHKLSFEQIRPVNVADGLINVPHGLGDVPGGLINIITKDGKFRDRRRRYHFKSLMPLGYATPEAFYSPRYDAGRSSAGAPSDLRATVYWKPDVVVPVDGKASVDFYAADLPATYTVVAEGVCPDGTLIYRHEKAIVKVKK
jgi:hypothetical protein